MKNTNIQAARYILIALQYLDKIEENFEDNDFITFEHGKEYMELLDKALDFIGVDPDTWENETNTGFCRDWAYDAWHPDHVTTVDDYINTIISDLNRPQGEEIE